MFSDAADVQRCQKDGGSILKLLERHGSLGYEDVAALLNLAAADVRNALEQLRERRLVVVVTVGAPEDRHTPAASYWRLTDRGRKHLNGI